MNKIVIGKYVNTHGLKGEIRIKSNFKYKDRVFQIGKEIIIDKPYKIISYRRHKDYDMVMLEGINSIDDIISLKGSLVYIDRNEYLSDSDYLDADLINFDVYTNNELVGVVENVEYLNNNKKLLVVKGKLIPFELVKKVDLENKMIIIEYLEGLI